MAKFKIKSAKTMYIIEAESYTDARHWAINHCDMSEEPWIVLKA